MKEQLILNKRLDKNKAVRKSFLDVQAKQWLQSFVEKHGTQTDQEFTKWLHG